MSRSEIMAFAENPDKWINSAKQDDSTKATDWGSCLDCLLTCPNEFENLFAVCPETYPAKGARKDDPETDKPWNRNATFCREWEEKQGNKIVLKPEILIEAQSAVKTLRQSPDIKELFDCSAKQVMVIGFWHECGMEIPLKGLIDLVPDVKHDWWKRSLGDSKTARNGNPAIWPRVCDDSGYDIQAALYLDLYCAATGEDRTDFVFSVQENEPPYHVVTPIPCMSQEFLAFGRAKYQNALSYYAQCLSSGIWPGYTPAGTVIGKIQIVSPENLFSYKSTAGQGNLASAEQFTPKPEPKPFVSTDPT